MAVRSITTVQGPKYYRPAVTVSICNNLPLTRKLSKAVPISRMLLLLLLLHQSLLHPKQYCTG
jgi:hypothetical protein